MESAMNLKFKSVILMLFIAPQLNAEAILTVNDQPIERSSFESQVNRLTSQGVAIDNALQNKILEELVVRELMRQEAIKLNLQETEYFKTRLQDARATILSELLLKTWYDDVQILEGDVQAEYDSRLAFNKDETQYDLNVIVTKTKQTALEVIKSINAGSEFAEVARNLSIDVSSELGGKLGWRLSNEVIKDISNVMVNLPENMLSFYPIESQSGWYVIKVSGSRQYVMPELSNISDQILRDLKSLAVQKKLSALRSEAKVK